MSKLPKTIGPYKILDQLGEGGYSRVLLAESEKTGHIALKVLRPAIVRDSVQLRRFQQEARIIAELDHPHIIKILDTGESEEYSFIAMEYVSGGNLRKRLKVAPFSREEAVHIVSCISEALVCVHSHQNQIIHRDLKPENVLLDTNDERLRPILTDFGSIKQLLPAEEYTNLTSTGGVIGTYYYMAPEQLDNGDLTPLTDLYALAIVFFEMLTGQHPFKKYSIGEIMKKQHLTQPLPSVSKLVPNLAPNIGLLFDEIFIKATAESPSDRFQSMAEFIKAVEIANAQAKQVEIERHRHQSEAASAIKMVRSYMQRSDYKPDRTLEMIDELALSIVPDYDEALRLKGQIYFKLEQFSEALKAYEQAYIIDGNPASEAGIDYLKALKEVAETRWKSEDREEAVEYYHRIVEIIGENVGDDTRIQEIQKRVGGRLLEFHRQAGEKAFSQGSPQNIDKAIKMIAEHIKWLDHLGAESESLKLLRSKQRKLYEEKFTDRIKAEEKRISELKPKKTDDVAVKDEDIIQSYLTIDDYYQKLIELEPYEHEWLEKRLAKLEERVETRKWLADLAEKITDFETALTHYRAIQKLEQTEKQLNVAKILEIDLPTQIDTLEKKADYAKKYEKIEELIDRKEYLTALDKLEKEFIKTGGYKYRDVARLLWGLVHANRHAGEFPPEWGFVQVKQELANVQSKSEQKLYTLRLLLVLSLIPALVLGTIIGILAGMIFSWGQSLPVLIAIAFVTILISVGLREISKRVAQR